MKLYGALEAGGTKMICSVANETFEILYTATFPTESPENTMPKIIHFFKQYDILALGIACFGPVDIHKKSVTYGHILNTPKLAWQHFDFVGTLKQAIDIPMFLETDVNVAAYGELQYGKAKAKNSCLYLTIGTGVGGGYASDKGFLSALLHTEMGHIALKKLPHDTFIGGCPFHQDCMEGLVSGPAIEQRTGKPAFDIASDDAVWHDVAYYIAQALVTYTMTLSPEIIVLGGGVMQQTHLLPLIQESFIKQLAGYIDFNELGVKIEEYIVYSGEKNEAAIVGALALAQSLI